MPKKKVILSKVVDYRSTQTEADQVAVHLRRQGYFAKVVRCYDNEYKSYGKYKVLHSDHKIK